MNRSATILALAAAGFVVTGCAKKEEAPPAPAEPAAPAVDIAAEEAAIRNRSGEWMNFANAKDIESIAGIFSPDVITVYDGNVRRGAAEGVWEREGRRVAIPPMGEHPDLDAFPVDLTGDRRDELVLVYRAPPGGRDRVVVLDLGSS